MPVLKNERAFPLFAADREKINQISPRHQRFAPSIYSRDFTLFDPTAQRLFSHRDVFILAAGNSIANRSNIGIFFCTFHWWYYLMYR